MSLKIGQVLSSQIRNNPISEVADQTIDQIASRDDVIGKGFLDTYISGSFVSGKYYYLKLKVQRLSTNQTITIKLDNGDTTEDYSQYIDDFFVYSTDSETPQWAYYETIIAPGTNYNQIRLVLTRITEDFKIYEDEDKNKGRIIILDTTESKVYQIANLIQKNSNSTNNLFKSSTLVKFGIQGPSGMLMCINGQGIRIGPSGIYEIKDGYKINFLSILPKTSYQIISDNSGNQYTASYTSDVFVIDYQYDDTVLLSAKRTINNSDTEDDQNNNNTEGE